MLNNDYNTHLHPIAPDGSVSFTIQAPNVQQTELLFNNFIKEFQSFDTYYDYEDYDDTGIDYNYILFKINIFIDNLPPTTIIATSVIEAKTSFVKFIIPLLHKERKIQY